MTLPTKEQIEPATYGAKSPAGSDPASARPDTARMRADAVSLDVPVKVHGSRVTDVVLGTTPHTEPFEEETSTMIVFSHGGVVRMATAVNVGQMLVLTNQRTKQDAICRVVKVRAYSNAQAYVEVEFTHRQSGFWGVHFSTDDEDFAAVPPSALPAAPPPVKGSISAQPAAAPVVSSVSVRVQDMPPVAAPLPRESAFVSIGSQEEIQPAASNTSSRQPVPRNQIGFTSAEPLVTPPAPVMPLHSLDIAPNANAMPKMLPVPAAAPYAAQSSVTVPLAVSEAAVRPSRPSRSFGTLTGSAVATPSTAEMGTRLGSSIAESPSQNSTGGGKGLMIAACIAFLLVGLAIGAWYFRQHPGNAQLSQPQPAVAESPANSNAVPQPSALETQNLPVSERSQQTSQAAGSVTGAAVQAQAPPSAANSQRPLRNANDSADSVPRESAEPAAREPKSTPMGNIGMAVMGARPVTQKSAHSVAAAPEITSAASSPAIAIPGAITAGTPNLPPPPPAPMQRVRIGGLLVPAKVLRSVAPVYPSNARAAGIEGDVVITAQVDESGRVTGMQVVSGVAVLRQAALDALKNWKYQPATLNGQPVASQVNVTIQFRK